MNRQQMETKQVASDRCATLMRYDESYRKRGHINFNVSFHSVYFTISFKSLFSNLNYVYSIDCKLLNSHSQD